jgi:hypothetical protein
MTPAQRIRISAFLIGGPCGSFGEISQRTSILPHDRPFPDAEVMRFTEISIYAKFTDAEMESMRERLQRACSTVAGKCTMSGANYGLSISLAVVATAEQEHQLHRWLINEEARHRMKRRRRPAA